MYTRFDHRDNRNGDPNLHTHVAISTKVQGVDGKWRSLDGRVLHKLAVAASERYNTLIEEYVTRELGTVFADRPGTGINKRAVREIEGIPTALLSEFSRRDAIESRLEKLVSDYRKTHGKDPSTAMQMRLADHATLETRNEKAPPKSLGAQRAECRERALNVVGRRALCVAHQRERQAPSATPTRSTTGRQWQAGRVRTDANRTHRSYVRSDIDI